MRKGKLGISKKWWQDAVDTQTSIVSRQIRWRALHKNLEAKHN